MAVALGALVFAPVPVSVSAGDVWDWSINATGELAYDDNWGLDVQDPVSGFRLSLTPDIFLRWGTDRALVEADAGVRLERYFDLSQEEARTDRQDPFAGIRGRYLLPYGSIGGGARYSEDALFESEFNDTGVTNRRGTRKLIGLDGFWTRELTDTQALTVSGGYDNASYDSSDTTNYTDYENYRAALTYEKALGELTTALLSANTQLYRPDDSQTASNQDAYYLTAGVNRQLSPTWSGDVLLGYGVINRDQDDETKNGWLGNVGLTHLSENGRLSFGAGRELQPSGAGELSVRDRVYVDVGRQLSDRWGAGLSAWWGQTNYPFDNLASATQDDSKQFEIRPGVSYQLAPQWSLNASYRYRWQKRDSDEDSADSNAAFLSVSYVPEGL